MSVWWRLLDPFGNEVFSAPFNDVNDVTQRVAGVYILISRIASRLKSKMVELVVTKKKLKCFEAMCCYCC